MASDGIEAKSIGVGLGPDVDLTDETASIIEMAGVIKWFDVAKGYGFIVPDNGMADVLLHVTCLRRDGYQTAYEGARVVCEVLPRPKGLQAFRVISIDDDTVAVLRQRKMDQAAEQLRAGDSWRGTKDGYVFTTGWGEPIYPDTVTSLMTKLIRANTQLPHARPHDLRHLHATTQFGRWRNRRWFSGCSGMRLRR